VLFSDTSEVISTGRLHITPSMATTINSLPGGPLILDVDPDGHMDNQYWVA
jgi:hypothetical protein